MTRRLRTRGSRLITAASLLAASACGGAPHADTAKTAQSTVINIGWGLASRADQARFSDEFTRSLEQTRAPCLRDLGYGYIEAPVRSLGVPQSNLGDSPLEYAQDFGFGFSDEGSGPFVSNPNDEWLIEMSNEERARYQTDYGKCSAQAQRDNPMADDVRRAKELAEEVERRVRSSEAVTSAEYEWHQCDQEEGIRTSAATPEDLRSEYSDRLRELMSAPEAELAAFDREQITAAVASLKCAENLQRVLLDERKRELESLDAELYSETFED